MAFFTKLNTSVPLLPTRDECHSESSTTQQSENFRCTDSEGADGEDVSNSEDQSRYEYVVDRVLGVEV